MADMRSCEGKMTTLECMMCGYREVFTERQFKFTDGLRCNECDSPVQASITKPGEKINNRRMNKRGNSKSVGTLTIELDCSDALKGLKAVQKEAKKAAAALREVEKLTLQEPNEIVTHAHYECLICEHKEQIRGPKEEYKEVRVCPKCKGAFIDIWKISKYIE